MFPEQDDVVYEHAEHLSGAQLSQLSGHPPLCCHVAALAFDSEATLKPRPGMDLCQRLLDQFLAEGFVTETEPLLAQTRSQAPFSPLTHGLWMDQVGHQSKPLLPFSLTYIKGTARASSLHAMLHVFMKYGLDVKQELPTLHHSLLRIKVHCVIQGSRVEEAMTNMKLSCRGSLRKATNTMQICFMIKNLMRLGLTDSQTFIRRWNEMSSKQFQIVGKRAVSFKLLFEQAPQDSENWHVAS